MAEPIVNNQTAPSIEAISGIESLGQADGVEVFTTTAQTAKNWYAIYFVTESVITEIAAANIQEVTGSTAGNLATTIAAGTTLFLSELLILTNLLISLTLLK